MEENKKGNNRDADAEQIRRLLDRFYLGETSREEERELAGLLDDARDLPSDLQRERTAFFAICRRQDYGDAGMPPHAEKHITKAVEAEMRKARGRGSAVRRALAVAVAAAACLLIVWNLPHDSTDKDATGRGSAKTVLTAAKTEPEDSLPAAVAGNTPAKKNVTARKPAKRKSVQGESASQCGPAAREPNLDDRRQEEEPILIAHNRRVVEDRDEAIAIINSVFARLDDNMREEECRMEEITDQYETGRNKLWH